jgi:hypothetical protein
MGLAERIVGSGLLRTLGILHCVQDESKNNDNSDGNGNSRSLRDDKQKDRQQQQQWQRQQQIPFGDDNQKDNDKSRLD